MKNRFTALDVAAVASNMRATLVGMRASNIYGINGKTYMIKLHAPAQDKKYVLIESGTRVHGTKYMREKPRIPSVFTLKLRKHIRSKRLENVQQLGMDRVLDFTFGQGEAAYHLLVELHSKGNVLLADCNYNIITLLRTYKYKDTGVLIAVNQRYPVEDAQQFESVSKEKLEEALRAADKGTSLKQAITRCYEFSPAMVTHCLVQLGLNGNHKVAKFDYAMLDRVYEELCKGEEVVAATRSQNTPGWVVLRTLKTEAKAAREAAEKADEQKAGDEDKKDTDDGEAAKQEEEKEKKEDAALVAYDVFVPFLYSQYADREVKAFATFDEAADDFFSKNEAQKVDIQRTTQAGVVDKKLAKVKADQTKRIEALERKEEDCLVQAQLIQDNLEDVEKALLIIRSAIANSIDWTELARIIKEEQKNGDPIAQMIHRLKLDQNQITVLLSQKETEDDDDDDVTLPAKLVDLTISLSGYANMERYYSEKKASAAKKQKTKAVVSKAMKRAEKKVRKDVQLVKVKKGIQRLRKALWFEKFYWFVSSDGYLIISGHDAQQNEIIVKRYLSKGDLYIHADLHGAASVVIKNPKGTVIPPTTMEQAGTFAICRSAAWNAKVITSAYWVYPHQVSKTAPSGEYLTTGSFMIRGKKNFLPPVQLIMGFGILFRIDDACVQRKGDEIQAEADRKELVASQEGEPTLTISDLADTLHQPDPSAGSDEVATDSQEDVAAPTAVNASDGADDNNNNDELHKEAEEAAEEANTAAEERTAVANANEEREGESDVNEATIEAKTETEEKEEEEASEESEEEFQPRYAGIAKKYQVDKAAAVEEEQQEKIERSRPRLSKKQRRMLKKGLDPNTVTQAPQPQNSKGQQQKGKGKGKGSKAAQKEAAKPMPRRKKNKLKKIKEKYADQDDEEREIRLRLLGGQAADNGAGSSPGDSGGSSSDAGNATQPKDERPQKSKEQIAREVKAREEELANAAKEAMSNTSLLDTLKGAPAADDIITAAIPMCGPYNAFQKFKYKVKLVPGKGKTGATCKTALSVFNKVKDMTDQERSAMKTMSDSELHQQMLGNSVVTATPSSVR